MTREFPAPRLLVAVAIGGMLGALARWGIGELVHSTGDFPWATFAVNVTGSAALAALPALDVVRRSAVLPAFLGPGVLGGFTTLSTYAEEGRALFADGDLWLGMAYVVGTLLACVVAVRLAHRLSTREEQVEFELEEGNE